jgi:LmbE family N-acetylglucosaminyl deacetylase
MKFFGKRLVFIGAHPDDIEIGCGALIANIAEKAEIKCVTLSDNQKNPDLNNLIDEHYDSMAVLGVPKDNVVLGPFSTRFFPDERQKILEYLLAIHRNYKPDIVFVHSGKDVHQDHNTVTQEALRAFRGTTVLGFDVIRSSHGFFPDFLVEVSEEDVQKKITALAQYKTYENKYYFNAEITRSTLIRNGAISERKYAEGFDILRIVGKFEV